MLLNNNISLEKHAVTGVKWNSVSIFVSVISQFITLAILARLLTPSDFGLVGMIMVVIGFAQAFSDVGISNAIIYRQNITIKELSSLYWLNIFAGLVIFLAVYACTPLVIAFYHEPRLNNLLYLASVSFLIMPLGQQFQALLQKELQFSRLAKIEIIGSCTYSLISVLLSFSGYGAIALIWGQLAGTSIRTAMLLRCGLSRWRPKRYFARNELKGYLSFGLYQMGERTVNYFNSNLDSLLIGWLLGAKSLGFYILASNLALKPLSLINPAITRVAFPVFSNIQDDTLRLRRGYLKMLRLLSLVNFPMMVGLASVSMVAVPCIFGSKWLPSVLLVQVLAIVSLLRSLSNPVGTLIMAKGRADLGFMWNTAIIIMQIPGLYLGVMVGGMVGVVVALAILNALYIMIEYRLFIKTILGSCLREYSYTLWPALWMSAIMAISLFVIRISFGTFSKTSLLIIQIVGGFTVYVGLIFYFQKVFLFEMRDKVFYRKA